MTALREQVARAISRGGTLDAVDASRVLRGVFDDE